jgi:hypothetical protein
MLSHSFFQQLFNYSLYLNVSVKTLIFTEFRQPVSSLQISMKFAGLAKCLTVSRVSWLKEMQKVEIVYERSVQKAHVREGKSQRAIARELGINRQNIAAS